jgi:hypothetical protein
VFTSIGDATKDVVTEERAREVAEVLRRAHASSTGRSSKASLLADVRQSVVTGRLSYYVYLVTCVVALLATLMKPDMEPLGQRVTATRR